MSDPIPEERLGPDGLPLWVPKKPFQGRPPRLVQEVGDLVLEAVGAGMSIDGQAKYAGIGHQTLRDWLARGESEAREDWGFAAFLEAYKKAEGKVIFYSMQNILMGVDKWQAFAWHLERRYPDDYGLKKDQFPIGSVIIQKAKPEKGEDDLDPALVDDGD